MPDVEDTRLVRLTQVDGIRQLSSVLPWLHPAFNGSQLYGYQSDILSQCCDILSADHESVYSQFQPWTKVGYDQKNGR